MSSARKTSSNAPKPAGRVWLVGAGPGDPDLLTIRARRTIRQATLLLVDDLVGEGVLDVALRGLRRRPRVVHVGKRGGCASTPQAFIERLMVSEARAGERVVRLKGGDPFVFGRGGEEVETLRAAGIEVEVVHGITSGLVAASALGVPWTHRQHAQGVMLITGHAREGGTSPDWAVIGAAAAQGLTLVIYMGMARLAELQAALLRSLPAGTPAAVVQHAGTADQRMLVSSLADVAREAVRAGFGSPAIVIVGNVLRGRAACTPPVVESQPADAVDNDHTWSASMR